MEMAGRLTKQTDYLSLTEELLVLLHKVPTLKHVRVFEVHSATKDTELCDVATEDLIVREVINDLDDLQPFNDIACLQRAISKQVENSDQAALSHFQQIVLPIPCDRGLVRILLIEADFVEIESWSLIHSLSTIYRNQLLIFDEKERDQLTGLYNRQTFDEKLARVMRFYLKRAAVAGRGGKQSWLAVLDIDHFKQVNDNYGHMIGDEVLLLFSRVMEQSFRHTDMLFRYGGEEFIVIMNGCTDEGVIAGLERFREDIEHHEFPQVGCITVSIGYVLVEEGLLPSTLIEQADKALYFAKDSGRNRVVWYGDLAEESPTQEGEIELF